MASVSKSVLGGDRRDNHSSPFHLRRQWTRGWIAFNLLVFEKLCKQQSERDSMVYYSQGYPGIILLGQERAFWQSTMESGVIGVIF